jgi:NDP-sugar pyrophosphorylase family protein
MGVIDSGVNIIIEKPTCFGELVKLENRVRIKELSSIGKNVIIGEDTVIEKSVLWDDVKVGAGCIITNSIICNDCEIGDNVVLERATVAPNCKISSDSQIRNEALEIGSTR